MRSRLYLCLAAAGLVAGAVAAAAPAGATTNSHGGHKYSTLYVSNRSSHERGSSSGHSCAHASFTTIGAAVSAAGAGDTVIVCPGTYAEDVQITKSLNLFGRHATINAAGLVNGIAIMSSHVSVSGLTVTGALDEGIVAEPPGAAALGFVLTDASQALAPISNVYIWDNVVTANNTGGDPTTHQCVAAGLYPGDCGGGLHLDAVSYSWVWDNTVTHNDDGILVTDDVGPAFKNVIAHNYVAHNIYECGIVLPSHDGFSVSFSQNPDGTYSTGALTPSTGGIFDNQVVRNTLIDNGSVVVPPYGGAGSGVGIFAPAAGTASYDNTVADNYIVGSGQSGFTIHAHYLGGEYISGNQVIGNWIGTNNIGGDGLDGPSTDPDFQTTGILVFSAVHVDMKIAWNHIWGNSIGIWKSADVNASGLGTNTIHGATTPIYTSTIALALTGPAISTSAPAATVAVLVNPQGLATTYYVEYGTTSSYGMTTSTASAGSATTVSGYAVQLTGLTAGVTYHYQVVAVNGSGTNLGGDQTFTAS